ALGGGVSVQYPGDQLSVVHQPPEAFKVPPARATLTREPGSGLRGCLSWSAKARSREGAEGLEPGSVPATGRRLVTVVWGRRDRLRSGVRNRSVHPQKPLHRSHLKRRHQFGIGALCRSSATSHLRVPKDRRNPPGPNRISYGTTTHRNAGRYEMSPQNEAPQQVYTIYDRVGRAIGRVVQPCGEPNTGPGQETVLLVR